jgi:hypothetical protein
VPAGTVPVQRAAPGIHDARPSGHVGRGVNHPSPRPNTGGVRVLCYSPYNRWALHGRWEMTVLQALRVRGADVHYVLCDGLYSDCDVHWAATDPRPADACGRCQAQVAALVASMGMPYHWLGRYLMPEEVRTAREWTLALGRDDVPTATYGDWPVAEWVRGSVHSHLRRSDLDMADERVEAAYRSYVYSGLVAAFALTRLLDESQPDVMLQFNGRQSSTRVALELARRRGIRVITHERGFRKECLQLVENATCNSLEPMRAMWRAWGDVPLSATELETVAGHLAEREHGQGLSWRTFTAGKQPVDIVRRQLGLDAERPTWVLFTSSDDEVVADDDWRGDFPSQLDWIERTVAYAAAHPELQLVIRVHPNTGSRRSTGANARQLAEMRALAERLPANVRMVAPEDEISSYTLMEIAAAGLVYHSTVGLEVACKGKAVVAAAGSLVSGLPFARTVESADRYEVMLDDLRALEPDAVDPEVRRLAHRFAYGRFFRTVIPFPLVRMPSPLESEVAWSSLDDLRPGRDAGVDRCAEILFGAPPCPSPTAAARPPTRTPSSRGPPAASRPSPSPTS